MMKESYYHIEGKKVEKNIEKFLGKKTDILELIKYWKINLIYNLTEMIYHFVLHFYFNIINNCLINIK